MVDTSRRSTVTPTGPQTATVIAPVTDSAVTPRPASRYHPALDGLRAIAVGAVLLYHGGSAWLPGGFLGVDLFFVLSGFLISGLLLTEWEHRSQLDLRDFWRRRARRLLPALLLVLAATAIAAMVVGGAIAETVRGDGLASLFYVSNWWFISEGASYSSAYQVPSPLQHTWSLAIEEQWYLLLPLALLLVLPRLGLDRRVLAAIFVALAVLSALWMAFLAPDVGSDPSRVYFGTDTRIQSLLIGGALACVAPLLGGTRKVAVAAVGSALLLVAAMVTVEFQNPQLYRGGFLLVAVAVAAVIADVTQRPDGVLARALSLPPLVAVGKISYGLYLWHWPVYVFLNANSTGRSGPTLLLLRLVVTVALAILSYHFVEMPVRRGGLAGLSPRVRRSLVAGALLVVVALLVLVPRFSGVGAASQSEAARQQAQAQRIDSPRVALLGDSQVLALAQLYPAQLTGLNVAPVLEFGCGLVPYDADINGERMEVPEQCRQWAADYRSRLAAIDPQVGVLVAGSWEQYDRWTPDGAITVADPRWSAALQAEYSERLKALHDTADEVVVILNHCHGVPEWELPLQTQFRAGRYPPVTNDPARIDAVNTAARADAAEQSFPVRVIDINPVVCPNGYQDSLNGVELRSDGLHFSEAGAELVWQYLDPRLQRLSARVGP